MNIFTLISVIMVFAFLGNRATATDYQTYFVDSISNYDTIIYCPDIDSLRFIPPADANECHWYAPVDTINTDTLVLPNDYEGSIQFTDFASIDIHFQVYPFTISTGENITISCGNDAQLEVTTNYPGNQSYVWSPQTGLNDPEIYNPTVNISSSVQYTVTVTTDNNCQLSDTVHVFLESEFNPEICMVGVENNHNIVIWNKPLSSKIDSFYIYKEAYVTDVYEKIGAVPYSDSSLYPDTTSHPQIQSNKYKLSIIDTCGLESTKSPFHKTMHLSLNQGQNDVWNLIWEPYEGFTVSTYYIYRGTTPDNLELIGSSPASNTQYSDFSAPAGYVYYQIEIVSPNACNPQKETYSISRSNIVTNKPSGIEDSFNKTGSFTMYPNPAHETITIHFTHANLGSTLLTMHDITGKTVMKEQIKTTQKTVNVSECHEGVYVVKIKTNNGVKTQQLLIMR